ncbi:MAG: lipoate--protein ligase [Bacteroidia bacterium]|nr:lipoate--protein ligase [Bacteroidia bacterium]
MIEVLNNSLNPYFNIACEEYIIKNFSQDCFVLWQNSPSVIVGKHQNTFAEIDNNFVNEKHLAVIRRISGGGTVYHDLGNLNFSYITNVKTDRIINFDFYTKPIIDLLSELGITATLNSRNNIFIGEKKITGTAAHIFKNRVIHHGTLLFSTSIEDLEKSIENNKTGYKDKAIKSVRNTVTNISDHLTSKINLEIFRELLRSKINTYFEIVKKYHFTDNDITNINNLVISKYQTWEWNYGYSPAFKFSNSTSDNLISTEISIKQGIIETILFTSKNKQITNFENIAKALKGKSFNKASIKKTLQYSLLPMEEDDFYNLLGLNN